MLTPETIASRRFDKQVGGYKQDEVEMFLQQVAGEYAKLLSEKEDLEEKIEVLAEKVEQYREDEDSLRSALIGAQKLGDSVIRESKSKAEYILREAQAQARYVTGRTAFDRSACAALAPAARYFACNETLRPLFYTGTPWHAREFGAAPVLFLPQGNYPLKNLHTALRALPAVLAAYGDAQLVIAGWPPLDKGPLLRPVIDRMFPYKRYCKQLTAELGIAGHIRYTGPLDAAAMRQAYLEADVFLLPSCCENSPNSLGEAMLLGLPCVAAAVGGIPSMLENGREGLLYGDALDDKALADAVLRILQSADGGMALGRAARARALQTHDAARNAGELEQIYKTILQEEQP